MTSSTYDLRAILQKRTQAIKSAKPSIINEVKSYYKSNDSYLAAKNTGNNYNEVNSKREMSRALDEIINKLASFDLDAFNNFIKEINDSDLMNQAEKKNSVALITMAYNLHLFQEAIKNEKIDDAMSILTKNPELIHLEIKMQVKEAKTGDLVKIPTTPFIAIASNAPVGEYDNVSKLLKLADKAKGGLEYAAIDRILINAERLNKKTPLTEAQKQNMGKIIGEVLEKRAAPKSQWASVLSEEENSRLSNLGIKGDKKITIEVNKLNYSRIGADTRGSKDGKTIDGMISLLKNEKGKWLRNSTLKETKIKALENIKKAIITGGDVRKAYEAAINDPKVMSGFNSRTKNLLDSLGKIVDKYDPKVENQAANEHRISRSRK